MSLVSPCLPSMSEAFGVSYEGAGGLVGMYFLSYCLSVVVGGPLSDRLGRKPIILAGTALLALGTPALALVPDLGWALVVVLVLGLSCAADVIAQVHLSGLGGDRRGRLLSLGHGVYATGAVLVPILAGAALDAGWTFRDLFWVSGGVCVAVAVFVFTAPGLEVAGPQPSPGPLLGLFRSGPFRKGLVLAFLYVAAEVGLSVWLPTLFLDRHGCSELVASASVAAFWTAMAVGRFGFGPLLDRVDRMRLLALLGGAAAGLSAIGLTTDDATAAFCLLTASGLFHAAVYPLLQSHLVIAVPRTPGAVLGWMAAASAAGGAAGPWIVGALAEALGCGGTGLSAALWINPLLLAVLVATALAGTFQSDQGDSLNRRIWIPPPSSRL
jgi:fucose permease